MRKPLIAGNWKMHKTMKEAREFIQAVAGQLTHLRGEAAICAPFTTIGALKEAAEGTPIQIGAQNMHYELKGAFTGEISAPMLQELGIDFVIIGHSERRQYFAETDETVNLKVKRALEFNITPILCVGESLEEREEGKTFDKILFQLEGDLRDLSPQQISSMVIAYEPIWAIGTGKTATSSQANEVIAFIRKTIREKFGQKSAEQIRILYGGSVKPSNIAELMEQEDIDGALVGGACLEPGDFVALAND